MFNIKKDGIPIAVIKEGPFNGQKIYINTENDINNKSGQNEIFLKSGEFQQIPYYSVKEEILRRIWYITGPSGCGKSVYVSNIIIQWKKLSKNFSDIFIFSALQNDKNLDHLHPKRFKIDKSLIDEKIDIKDYKNSLFIFDDIDAINDLKIREETYRILDEILITGRHYNISCIMTNHDVISGKNTKRILSESHYIVYFPHKIPKNKIDYLLTEYLGIESKKLKKIRKIDKSKWSFCCISKEAPMYAQLRTKLLSLHDSDSETDSD